MQSDRYANLKAAITGEFWDIDPRRFEQMMAQASLRNFEPVQEAAPKPSGEFPRQIAVLPLNGVMMPKGGIMLEIFGGTSMETFGRAFDSLIRDPQISAVVLDVDSPGGSAAGSYELAQKVYKARGVKPVLAVANPYAASAAYKVAAAASELVVTPTGMVGSVGTIAVHYDYSKANEMAGVKPTYITAGKYKAEGNYDGPLDDEALAERQRIVDEYHGIFVGALARYRNIPVSQVRETFGQGRMAMAKQAVEANMADRVATLEEVIADLRKPADGRRRVAAMRKRLELA